MKKLFGPRLVATGAFTAVLCLAVGYMTAMSASGSRCKTAACSYFDAKGQSLAGTCGARKNDKKNCYCILDTDKAMSQLQSGCSLTQ